MVLKTPFGFVQVARKGSLEVCLLVWNNKRLAQSIRCLTSESVKGASLSLEGVHDVKSGDGLAASVLGVGDSVSDDVLKEHLQDTSGLLVDEARDSLDTTSAGQSADSRLGDSLDVVSEDLAVSLGSALAQSLSSFSASRHD